MNKVIIITRDGEYNSGWYFFDAIKKMKDCPYNKNGVINETEAGVINETEVGAKNETEVGAKNEAAVGVIIQCLKSWPQLKWNDAKNKHKGGGGMPDTKKICQVLNLDYKDYVDQLKNKNDSEKWAVDKLKEKMETKMSPPYASFEKPDKTYEVILVLPEKLQIGRNEAIPNFLEFMNWVKQDCSISGDDNILYIHDTQLYGTAIKDTTVYDKANGIDLTEEENSLYKKLNLSVLKDTYKFIAIFRHLPDKTSYFQSQILSMRFGQPNLIDELGKKNSSNSWQDRIKETNEAVEQFKVEIGRKEGAANENV